MTPTNAKLNGGELITITATLTRDQWSILFMLMHQSTPMLPRPSWPTTEFIIEVLDSAYADAVSEAES